RSAATAGSMGTATPTGSPPASPHLRLAFGFAWARLRHRLVDRSHSRFGFFLFLFLFLLFK
ncbi:hypothetical protein, partial [uncultured Herbaspirillum sp.]|uniref:hypothetical protein n=1 Tax=uncultured Herbaspirillum sp. TaxID=160236 RepID=UPI0032B2CBDC